MVAPALEQGDRRSGARNPVHLPVILAVPLANCKQFGESEIATGTADISRLAILAPKAALAMADST